MCLFGVEPLSIVLLIITFLGVWRALNLVSLFSPGLDAYRFNLATEMLRITFPYLMLISLTSFVGSILNCSSVSLPRYKFWDMYGLRLFCKR
ncbi:lipid II flippase MurJ [Legionella sainthelensi]|nr:lipid II flippase MurJ [Legionella sainthelensi]